MIRMKHSKANLFLIELMINIVFFFILVSFCFRFFVKTEAFSSASADLQFAVCSCENLAAVYKSGDGSFESLEHAYPQGVTAEDRWILYFDKSQTVCAREEAYYVLEAVKDPVADKPGTVTQLIIQCQDQSGRVIHEIETCHYTSLYPEAVKGGDDHE